MLPNHPHAHQSNAPAFNPFAPLLSAPPERRRSSTANPSMICPPPTGLIPRRQPLPMPAPGPSHLDFPYAPPSAPPPSSQQPQSIHHHPYRPSQEGREESHSRPSSSSGNPVRYHPYSSYRPTSIAEAHMERYVPPRPSLPSGSQRSAAEVYQTSRERKEPKASKAPEILANIASLQSFLTDKFDERAEEERQFRAGLSEQLRSLAAENRDLKERVHELQMGQKILPTREELNEAITSQLSPALNECFQSHRHDLRQTIEPLGGQIAKQTAERVKAIVLDLQDTSRREWLRANEGHSPQIALMNHLIQALAPTNHIIKVFNQKTLDALSAVPAAIERVAVFEHTMGEIHKKVDERLRQAGPTTLAPTHVNDLQNAVKAVVRELEAEALAARLDQRLAEPTVGGRDTDRIADTVPQSSELARPASDPIATNSTSTGPEHVPPAERNPQKQPPSSGQNSPSAVSDGDRQDDLLPQARTPLATDRIDPVLPPTPITGPPQSGPRTTWANKHKQPVPPSKTHPMSPPAQRQPDTEPLGQANQVTEDDPAMLASGPDQDYPSTLTTGLLFHRASDRRPSSVTMYGKSKSHKRKRFAGLPTAFALVDADEASAKATGSTLSSLTDSSSAEKRDDTGALAVAAVSTSDRAPAKTSLPTPQTVIEIGSSDSSQSHRRKANNADSVKVKRERLDDVYGAVRHNTRAKVNEAREVGIDLLADDADQQSISRSTTASSANSRKGSAGKVKGRKSKGKQDSAQQTLSLPESTHSPLTAIPPPLVTPAPSGPSSLKQPVPTAAIDHAQSIIPETAAAATIPPVGESIDYIESDYGHGQPLSVPSIPHPWSTANDTFESQEATQKTLPTDLVEQKQSTSTDWIDQSLAIEPGQNSNGTMVAGTPLVGHSKPPIRREPSCRKHQVLGAAQRHQDKIRSWYKTFGDYDDSDDDD